MRLTTLLIFFAFCCIALAKNLIMINILFRHGARYPVYPKNDDLSNYTFTDHSFGELTIAGKKMHYLLGQKLYQRYWSDLFSGTLFNDTYNQSKFYIKSTDVNMTIESVQSQMMGVLQNTKNLSLPVNLVEFSLPQWPGVQSQDKEVFKGAPLFHPIAIHVEKGGSIPNTPGDFLRTYSSENCPNQNVWGAQNKEAPRTKQILNNSRITAAIQALSKSVGRNISFWQAPQYYDNYVCAKSMGNQFIKVFYVEQFRNTLDYIHTLEMYIYLYSNPQQIRATATGFFNETVHNIKKIIANKNQVQWNAYSAHDTTVGNMLAALNLTNVDCIYEAFLNNATGNSDTCISEYPLFTSNLIFELYEERGSHFIKLTYNGLPRKIPFCDWQFECPVQRLYEWYDGFKDVNYLSSCGVTDKQMQTYFSIAAAQFFLIVAMALVGVIGYLNKDKKQVAIPSATSEKSSKTTINTEELNTSQKNINNMIKQSLLTEQDQQEIEKES